MKERPILFSGPMVRAIIDGRKTQTRRAIKLKTGETFDEHALAGAIQEWRPVYDHVAGKVVAKRPALIKCPFGKPGDRLYVRETWAQPEMMDPGITAYRADYPDCVPWGYENIPTADEIKWKPSIHMPRDLSRITLEITDVRVERLQDISEDDAYAEGIKHSIDGGTNAREGFLNLWESINGLGSWDADPWVWAVEFRRVEMCET